MKTLKQFIKENNSNSEDLEHEVGLALKEFGNIKNGFKMASIKDIEDAMFKLGFDYSEEDSTNDKLVFFGEYIDDKYEIDLYAADQVSGKFKIKNFNVFLDK